MSYGPQAVYSVQIASFGTSTSAITMGRSWKFVYLEVPTMTSASALFIQGSSDGIAYRRIYHPVINTSSVQSNTFVIGSGVSQRMVPIPNGMPFMKVESEVVLSFTAAFKVICSD